MSSLAADAQAANGREHDLGGDMRADVARAAGGASGLLDLLCSHVGSDSVDVCCHERNTVSSHRAV